MSATLEIRTCESLVEFPPTGEPPRKDRKVLHFVAEIGEMLCDEGVVWGSVSRGGAGRV